MGRRPAFRPPLLTNWCDRTTSPSLPPIHGDESCATPKMGRRPAFCPPLLSNRCARTATPSLPPIHGEESCAKPGVNIARLSTAAACIREDLVSEVTKEEIGGGGYAPSTLLADPPPCSSSKNPTRVMQILLNSQEGQPSKKKKSPHCTMPLFNFPLRRTLLSPRIRSPSMKHMMLVQEKVDLGQDSVDVCLYSDEMGQDGVEIGHDSVDMGQDNIAMGQDVAEMNSDSVDMGQDDIAVDQDVAEMDSDSVDMGQDDIAVDQYVAEMDSDSVDMGQDNIAVDHDVAEMDSDSVDMGQDVVEMGSNNVRKNIMLSDEKRREIFEALLARSKEGKLKHCDTRQVSVQFSVHIRTVQRIWYHGRRCLNGGVVVDVRNKWYKCGRKKKDLDISVIKDIPLSKRTTIADVAVNLGVSRNTVHRMKKEGVLACVSSTLKPHLREENKKDRLKWCMFMLEPSSIPRDPIFKGLFDFVFIDEKWFNITRKTERYYIIPGEEVPTRTCRNKNFITKIMFLAALARPRFNSAGICTFDGKIGCFPFVTYEPAKRSSINRPAGTMELKPMGSIKKKQMQEFMIEKVLPAIRAKWPAQDAHKPIYIQQDNATPHITPNDKIFCEATKKDGFDIKIVCQPANSPDFNILDLGFFSSMQSMQYKSTSKTIEDLVGAVDKAFNDYSAHRANRIFLTLHACLREVMKIGGGNGYSVPHIKKGMLERQGRLPLQLKCDASLVQNVMEQMN